MVYHIDLDYLCNRVMTKSVTTCTRSGIPMSAIHPATVFSPRQLLNRSAMHQQGSRFHNGPTRACQLLPEIIYMYGATVQVEC